MADHPDTEFIDLMSADEMLWAMGFVSGADPGLFAKIRAGIERRRALQAEAEGGER